MIELKDYRRKQIETHKLFGFDEIKYVKEWNYSKFESFQKRLMEIKLARQGRKLTVERIMIFVNEQSSSVSIAGIARDDNAMFLVNQNGEVVSVGYEKIEPFEGKSISDAQLEVIKKIETNLEEAGIKEKKQIIADVHEEFVGATITSSDFRVWSGNKCGVINVFGESVIACEYDKIKPFSFVLNYEYRRNGIRPSYYEKCGFADLYICRYEYSPPYEDDDDDKGVNGYDVYSSRGDMIFNEIFAFGSAKTLRTCDYYRGEPEFEQTESVWVCAIADEKAFSAEVNVDNLKNLNPLYRDFPERLNCVCESKKDILLGEENFDKYKLKFKPVMDHILELIQSGKELLGEEFTEYLHFHIKKDEPIERLDLSVRAYNCLFRHGIKTVGELCEYSFDDFIKIRNLGRKNVEEIMNILAAYDIR